MAEFEKYFEDNTLANNWFNEVMNRIAYEMFRRQEDWIYMVGELGPDRKPMIKSEQDFMVAFDISWGNAIGWLKSFAAEELLKMYAEDDIDFPRDLADEYNNEMGFELGDDGYVEGKDV